MIFQQLFTIIRVIFGLVSSGIFWQILWGSESSVEVVGMRVKAYLSYITYIVRPNNEHI